MPASLPQDAIEVFSTCPPSSGGDPRDYARRVADVARWSEEAGCRGILVYSDNSLVDPWLASQVILNATRTLCPLVAVQPVYMHPYAVAKMVTTLAALHGRRVYLNMVAGGFKNDLEALGDPTPHDRRYQRLVEYTTIIRRLLQGEAPVSLEGEFYRVANLRLSPPLPPGLFPGIFISGSSEAGLAAARAIGATAIKYPGPVAESREAPAGDGLPSGIRVGIISRADEGEAWALARRRFPEDRRGQLAHQLAMKVSDSVWHRQLSEMDRENGQSPYWLVPFENYKTMCPYLVGSYDRVAREIQGYASLGYRTFILDVPHDPDDLRHIGATFRRALEVPA
jgi:alkanesulfonate monooxygenase